MASSTNSRTPQEQRSPQGDGTNNTPANSHHFQMPKFNKRMWQDGFGRFHRDTIPRRDNANGSPVSSRSDSCHGDTSTGPSWFVNPLMSRLGSTSTNLRASIKSLSSTSSSELIDDDDHDDDNNNGNASGLGNDALGQNSVPRTNSTERISASTNQNATFLENNSSVSALCGVSDTRSGIMRSRLLLPAHSSSLAEVLQSLPQQPQNFLYAGDNQNTDTFTDGGHDAPIEGQGCSQDRGNSGSQERDHPSLFEIIDQIQQHIQDNVEPTQPEDTAASSNDIHTGTPLPLSTSSRSSTWSNSALIQQLLQVLVNNSPNGTTSHGSMTSTQSSGSNTQHNWYFYDRRLVPDSCATRTTNAATIPQPPSYEEAAQAVGTALNANAYLFNQLAVLPNEPPPPYPDSDISPPPSYDSQSCSNGSSTSDISQTNTRDCHWINTQNPQITDEPNEIPNSISPANVDHHSEDNRNDDSVSHDSVTELRESRSPDHQRLGPLGFCRRPPVRWNRGMRLERWASTHNWAAEPVI